MGFEVFPVVKIHIMGFMVMTLCSLAVVMNVSDEYTVSVIRVIAWFRKGELCGRGGGTSWRPGGV
jgi:hypothetical protein